MIIMGGGNWRAMVVWGIISIVILVVSYFVIVRPILDTTNDTINNAFKQSQDLSRQISHDTNQAINDANHQANHTYTTSQDDKGN